MYIVDFMNKNKKGFGTFHRQLLETDYANYLYEIKVTKKPFMVIRKDVVICVAAKRKFFKTTSNDVVETAIKLRRFCELNKLEKLLIPLFYWVQAGVSWDLCATVFDKVFATSRIKIELV